MHAVQCCMGWFRFAVQSQYMGHDQCGIPLSPHRLVRYACHIHSDPLPDINLHITKKVTADLYNI